MPPKLSETTRKAPGLKLRPRLIVLLPSSLFFAGPYFLGALQALGDFHEHEALREMEPLRVVSVDGREWGKGIVNALIKGDQASMGLRP